MLNITKKFAKELKSINPISKFIIKSAGFLVIILYTLAV